MSVSRTKLGIKDVSDLVLDGNNPTNWGKFWQSSKDYFSRNSSQWLICWRRRCIKNSKSALWGIFELRLHLQSLFWFFNFLQHCEEVKTADFDKIPHNVWFANIVIQLCEEVLKINIFSSLVRNFSSSKKSNILRKRRIKVKTDFLAQCKARALRSNVLIKDLLILIWDLRSVKESKIHDLSSQI